MKSKLYIRATGTNQLAGGTARWLKIRNIKKTSDWWYEIEVIIRGSKKFVGVSDRVRVENLEFAKGWPGLQPVSCGTVISAFMSVTT